MSTKPIIVTDQAQVSSILETWKDEIKKSLVEAAFTLENT